MLLDHGDVTKTIAENHGHSVRCLLSQCPWWLSKTSDLQSVTSSSRGSMFGPNHVADETDLGVDLHPVFPRSRSGNTRERSPDSSTIRVAKRRFQLPSPLLTQICMTAISIVEMQL